MEDLQIHGNTIFHKVESETAKSSSKEQPDLERLVISRIFEKMEEELQKESPNESEIRNMLVCMKPFVGNYKDELLKLVEKMSGNMLNDVSKILESPKVLDQPGNLKTCQGCKRSFIVPDWCLCGDGIPHKIHSNFSVCEDCSW